MSLGTSTYKLSDTVKSKGKLVLTVPLQHIGEINNEGDYSKKLSQDQVDVTCSEQEVSNISKNLRTNNLLDTSLKQKNDSMAKLHTSSQEENSVDSHVQHNVSSGPHLSIANELPDWSHFNEKKGFK